MKEMEKYDKTTNDPAKAVNMARDTLSKLLTARNLMEKSGRFGTFRKSVSFENDKFINDKLLEWAKTDGRDAKRKVLFQIMQYVANYSWPATDGTKIKRKRKKTRKRKVTAMNDGGGEYSEV